MAVTQNRRFAGRVQPIGENQGMLGGGNDLDVFKPRILQAIGDKFRREIHVLLVFREGADARDPQKCEQLFQKSIFVLLDERSSGWGHDSIIRSYAHIVLL